MSAKGSAIIHLVVPTKGGPIPSSKRPLANDALGFHEHMDELRAIPAGSIDCDLAILCAPSFKPSPSDRIMFSGEPAAVSCPNCKAHKNFKELEEYVHNSGRGASDPQSFMTTEDMKTRAGEVEKTVAATDIPGKTAPVK